MGGIGAMYAARIASIALLMLVAVSCMQTRQGLESKEKVSPDGLADRMIFHTQEEIDDAIDGFYSQRPFGRVFHRVDFNGDGRVDIIAKIREVCGIHGSSDFDLLFLGLPGRYYYVGYIDIRIDGARNGCLKYKGEENVVTVFEGVQVMQMGVKREFHESSKQYVYLPVGCPHKIVEKYSIENGSIRCHYSQSDPVEIEDLEHLDMETSK